MTSYDWLELLRTVSSFVLMLVLISVMGWCVIESPRPKPLHLEYDKQLVKENIRRNQDAAMAKATASYNAWLEKRGSK